jgi:DNA-binding FadR family transcriptional regulator
MASVARTTLPEQIAASILERIARDSLKAGDMLPAEAKLAAEFKVSRPAVREALKWLAGQGYVDIVNGRGTMLRPADGAQVGHYFRHALHIARVPFAEMMEARKPLEVQSAALAARRRTPQQIFALQQIIERMRHELQQHHSEAYVDLDLELHPAIAACSHNPVIIHLIGAIRTTLNSPTQNSLYRRRTRQQLERVHELHEAIVDEIRAGNADAAARAMQIHFDEALAFLYRATRA